MNNQELLRKLLKAVAKENNLNLKDVERIFSSPFEFQALVMKNKCDGEKLEFPSVRIPFWGLFYCADYTKNRLKRLNKRYGRNSYPRRSDRKNGESIPKTIE